MATGHASAAQESDQSVDHNPEDLKSIHRQVPNMNAEQDFSGWKTVKVGLVQNALRLGNLSFFQGKKTSASLGSRKTACTRFVKRFQVLPTQRAPPGLRPKVETCLAKVLC